MAKREADLKARFTRELKVQRPTWLSLLQGTAGAADRALVGEGRTSWLEMKHATPDFRSPGLQELMCKRLEEQSRCWYIIWAENAAGGEQRTLLVLPSKLLLVPRRSSGLKSAYALSHFDSCAGYDMKWLVRRIIELHLANDS